MFQRQVYIWEIETAVGAFSDPNDNTVRETRSIDDVTLYLYYTMYQLHFQKSLHF